MAVRFHRDNDLKTAHELVFTPLRLVARIARDYLAYQVSFQDLVNSGWTGQKELNRGWRKGKGRSDDPTGPCRFQSPDAGDDPAPDPYGAGGPGGPGFLQWRDVHRLRA